MYAARIGGDRVDLCVLVDGTVRCNASGPSNAPPLALCSESSPAGSTYLATVDKGDEVPRMCDLQTGAGVAVDPAATPGSWSFDLVVGLASEQNVFLAPCSALFGG